MEISLHLPCPALLLLLLQISSFSNIIPPSLSAPSPSPNSATTTYIQQRCSVTAYPKLCYITLSAYSNEIQTNPRILATKALTVSLSAAKSASIAIKNISSTHGLSRRDAAAMADCVTVVSDSVYELQLSVGKLGRGDVNVGGGVEFSRMMSDVQTWVSAALTDEDTCMDGFGDDERSSLKGAVRGEVLKVAQLISNALALVNTFASLY